MKVLYNLQALEQKLSEAVGEAKAFAAQQQADADRTKRSYSQVPYIPGAPYCLAFWPGTPLHSASNCQPCSS